MEMRCPWRLHGDLHTPAKGGIVQFKCRSRLCGAKRGVVIIHRFSTEDAKLIETLRFRDPAFREKEVRNGGYHAKEAQLGRG